MRGNDHFGDLPSACICHTFGESKHKCLPNSLKLQLLTNTIWERIDFQVARIREIASSIYGFSSCVNFIN